MSSENYLKNLTRKLMFPDIAIFDHAMDCVQRDHTALQSLITHTETADRSIFFK